jgi:hypothetical protein|nr:MAG TPA: holin [Caudoviricetes sp.]
MKDKQYWVKWGKAAARRALKTAAQTFVAAIGTTATIGAVDWKLVCSTSALAAILSIGTSLAGLPEVEPNDIAEEDMK